jgi:hypothetical protein
MLKRSLPNKIGNADETTFIAELSREIVYLRNECPFLMLELCSVRLRSELAVEMPIAAALRLAVIILFSIMTIDASIGKPTSILGIFSGSRSSHPVTAVDRKAPTPTLSASRNQMY